MRLLHAGLRHVAVCDVPERAQGARRRAHQRHARRQPLPLHRLRPDRARRRRRCTTCRRPARAASGEVRPGAARRPLPHDETVALEYAERCFFSPATLGRAWRASASSTPRRPSSPAPPTSASGSPSCIATSPTFISTSRVRGAAGHHRGRRLAAHRRRRRPGAISRRRSAGTIPTSASCCAASPPCRCATPATIGGNIANGSPDRRRPAGADRARRARRPAQGIGERARCRWKLLHRLRQAGPAARRVRRGHRGAAAGAARAAQVLQDLQALRPGHLRGVRRASTSTSPTAWCAAARICYGGMAATPKRAANVRGGADRHGLDAGHGDGRACRPSTATTRPSPTCAAQPPTAARRPGTCWSSISTRRNTRCATTRLVGREAAFG